MMRIAVVDDHKVVRIGLKYVLMTDPELEFAGEAPDASDIIGFLDRVKPDVLLLDVYMPGKDGIAALAEVRRERPGVKVVMLTTSDTEEIVCAAIDKGASGYVLKDGEPSDVVMAIRQAASGGMYLPDAVKRIREVRNSKPFLTSREIEIISCVAKGLSNQEIGAITGISVNTVKRHLANLFDKLDAMDRASAVAAAYSRGILRP